MRQIDADALREKIEAYRKDAEKVLGMVGGCITNSIEYIISQIPTIESEPVKHGKWIKKSERAWFDNLYEVYYLCSCCNDIVYIMYNYCPNCGAKMEGEK